MKLIVARHAQSIANAGGRIYQGVTDSDLTEKGRVQARKLAERLKDHKIEIIYASPLTRALETAREIQKFHPDAEFVVEKDLREIDFGIFEGLSKEEASEKYPEIYKKRENNKFGYKIPEGESYAEAEERILKILTRIIKNQKNSIIVAHGAINRLIYKLVLKKPLEEFGHKPQKNTSISVFEIKEDNVTVEEFNCGKHLD